MRTQPKARRVLVSLYSLPGLHRLSAAVLATLFSVHLCPRLDASQLLCFHHSLIACNVLIGQATYLHHHTFPASFVAVIGQTFASMTAFLVEKDDFHFIETPQVSWATRINKRLPMACWL